MAKLIDSPMTDVPFMYDDDGVRAKHADTGAVPCGEIDYADEQAFMYEKMKLETPHPPIELFKQDPLEYLMEFMFLPRPPRLRECDWEFYCLHWQPVTFKILEICTEYCSLKNVALMNENAELERVCKNLGPRRTSVLTDEVYEARTITLTRRPRDPREKAWDRSDHIWCLCEGIKLFPKNLAKNQRFKKRLGLPVPGVDYEVVRGVVTNEIKTLYSRPEYAHLNKKPKPAKQSAPAKKNAAPATKPGGVHRKAATRAKKSDNKKKAAARRDEDDDDSMTVRAPSASSRSKLAPASAAATPGGGRKRGGPGKRGDADAEHTSEEEYVPGGKPSPKKKAKAKAGGSPTAARGRKPTRSGAGQGGSKGRAGAGRGGRGGLFAADDKDDVFA